jgi:hypothetical protein
MHEELAQRIFLEAFEDEMTKISSARGLTELEKQAFIGRMMKAVGKAFGKGKPAVGTQVAKSVRPKAPAGGKFLQSSGMTGRGNPTVMRTARTGGFQATRGGGARTGRYTAGIPLNLEKMSHVLALLQEA